MTQVGEQAVSLEAAAFAVQTGEQEQEFRG